MTAEVAFTRKLIEMGKYAQDLQDEISRLRAFMPADVLREYENLNRQSVDTHPSDAERVAGPRTAGQEFTCWCGLKTHDLTRPCPHWWGLLWGWLK